MKKFPILLTALLSAATAHADGNVYRAVIDGRINVLVTAKINGGQYQGSVVYDATGADGLSLEGQATGNGGGFEWKEMLWSRGSGETKQTGAFVGTLTADGTSGRGTWKSADGRKNLPFTLARLAKIETLADPTVDVRVDYPRFDDPRYAKLNARLADQAHKDLAAHVQAVKQWREEMKDIDTAALDRLSAATSCGVESATPQAVSLLCTVYEYSGGAHGNTGFEARNFILAPDGAAKPLGLWDLLRKSPANTKKLSDLIVAELKRQKASSVVDGSLKSFARELEQNALPFTVLANGLAFHFAPYVVGAYAEGPFHAVIPNRALAPLYRLEKAGVEHPHRGMARPPA